MKVQKIFNEPVGVSLNTKERATLASAQKILSKLKHSLEDIDASEFAIEAAEDGASALRWVLAQAEDGSID